MTGIIISYADRSNMAIAIVYMSIDFHFSSTIQGVILSSFFLGYITTQTLGGALADKYGGKWVLASSAALWTLFTFLTPFSAQIGLGYLLLCRILLGIGEGACFPTVNSLIASWFPMEEGSKAVSAIVSSAYIGIVVALPISTWLGSSSLGWPGIFWVFGIAGFVWSILWQIYGKSSPNEYSGISQEELDLITKSKPKNRLRKNLSYHKIESGEVFIESSTNENENDYTADIPLTPSNVIEENNEFEAEVDVLLPDNSNNLIPSNPKEVPWKFLFSRREVWAILIGQFCNSFGGFIILNWLPIYFLDRFKLDIETFGYYSVLPYGTQGATGIITGFISDYAINKLNIRVKTVRRSAQIIGAVGISTFLLCTAYLAQTPLQGIILLSIGTALNSFFICGVQVSQLDIAPKYAGTIYGLGNTFAGIPAILGVAFTGWILDITDRNWNVVWILVTIFYSIGSIFFVSWVGDKVIIE